MTEHEHDIIASGFAALASDDADETTVVNGVAIGEGDITEGMSGKRTRWPKEALREAVDHLVGKPITKQLGDQHVGAEKTDTGVSVSPNVPLEAKVGEVTQARYEEGLGLLWQGELKDPEMADKVEQGLAEVSPVLARDVELVEGEDDLFEATTVHGVRDLGLVSNGAAPSNSIQAGESQAMAAMSAEALALAFDESAESDADPDTDPQGDDGSSGQSTGDDTDNQTQEQFMELSDTEQELVAASRQYDDPTVVEDADATRLSDNAELLSEAQALDDPTVVDESEHEALSENVDTLRGVLEEALADQTGLKESTIEALSFDALCAEFEDDEGNLDAEALVQNPETGDVDGDDGNGGDPFADVDDEALAEAQAAKGRYEHWEGKNDTIAAAEQETIVEALGAESFEDVDMEAL